MKTRNQTEAFLLSEITQAWTHYRHLEDTRTKYLSFFSTVILTSAGFLVTILKDIDKFDPAQLVGSIATFCFLLFLFSFFIWANIARIGFILSAYETVLIETRKHILGESSSSYLLLDIRSRIPPTARRGIFSIQSGATTTVLSVCALLCCAEIYMSYSVLSASIAAPKWLGYMIGTSAISIIALVFNAFLRLRKAKRFKIPQPQISQLSIYPGE